MMQGLAHRTVLVTRPPQQAAALAQAVRQAGGSAVVFPALEIAAVPVRELAEALAQLATTDSVIFISPNAAQFGMAESLYYFMPKAPT